MKDNFHFVEHTPLTVHIFFVDWQTEHENENRPQILV